MSHSLLWKHIVLLTVGAHSRNYGVLPTIGISITKRFQKNACPFKWICPSVYPFLQRKSNPPLLLTE